MKKISPKQIIYTLSLIVVIGFIFLGINRIGRHTVDKNRYFIGLDSSWYPLNLQGKERHMLAFVRELLIEIAEEEGFSVRFVEVGPHSLVEGMERGNYNAIISSLVPNPYTRSHYTFSDPFYLVGPVLIVREDQDIRSLDELSGKIVGLESQTLQVFSTAQHPRILFVPFDRPAILLENLMNHTIDGVIMDALVAYVYTQGYYKGEVKIATAPLTEKGLRLVALTDPKSVELVYKFDRGLDQLVQTSRFDKLLDKWGIIDTEMRQRVIKDIEQANQEPI
ncbi:MAG: transporter substrate-binding domain-containing protein [Waddliaceae bacterium]